MRFTRALPSCVLWLLVLALTCQREASAAPQGPDLEKEFYALDFKIRQWDRLRQQNPKIVIPPGFDRDVQRYQQLAALMHAARTGEAAQVGAREAAKQSVFAALASKENVARALGVLDAKIEELKAEADFCKRWEEKWLATAEVDTAVAVTTAGGAPPDEQRRLRLQQAKDEAVRRQREIQQNIAGYEATKNQLQTLQTTIATALSAADIREAVGGDDFFGAAGTAIEAGKGLAKQAYDKKTFEQVSGRLGTAKGSLGAIQSALGGDYLKSAEAALDVVDGLVADRKGDLRKESATFRLLMNSELTDPALKKTGDLAINATAARAAKLQELQDFKDRITSAKAALGGVKAVIAKGKAAYGWYTRVVGEIEAYRRLASEPGRSGTTARLIAGMSKLGAAFNAGADYLPPGLKETIGPFLEFYGEALGLGDSVDKLVRGFYEKNESCLNYVGGLQRSHAVEEIDTRWPRDGLCLNYAQEFRAARLPLFVDENLGGAPVEPRYFFIPDPDGAPAALTTAQYTSLRQVASDFGAHSAVLRPKYAPTATDVGSMIEAVTTGRDTFTVSTGLFSGTTYTISRIREEVDILLRLREAVGTRLTPSSAAGLVKTWRAYDDGVRFAEQACSFTLFENDREKNRVFVIYLDTRPVFDEWLERHTLTNPASTCRAQLTIQGPAAAQVGQAVAFLAQPNASLARVADVRYEWSGTGTAGRSTSLDYLVSFAQEGEQTLTVKATGRAGGRVTTLAEARVAVDVRAAGLDEISIEISGPSTVAPGEGAPLTARIVTRSRQAASAVRAARIEWDAGAKRLGSGESFTFVPPGKGPYTIRARLMGQDERKRPVPLAYATHPLAIVVPPKPKPKPTPGPPPKPQPPKPEPAKPGPTKPGPTKPEPTKPEPANLGPTKPGPAPVKSPAGGGQPGTPGAGGGTLPGSSSRGTSDAGYWSLADVKDDAERPRDLQFQGVTYSKRAVAISGGTITTNAIAKGERMTTAEPEPVPFALASTVSWTELPKTIGPDAQVTTTLKLQYRAPAGTDLEPPLFGITSIRLDNPTGPGGLFLQVDWGGTETAKWSLGRGFEKDRQIIKVSHAGPGGFASRTYTYVWTAGAASAAFDVSVTVDRPAPTLGDTVTLSAAVTGGTSPYKYAWSGAATGAAATLPFDVKKPGRHDFTVIVTDAKGAKASAAAFVEVKAYVVTIALAGGATPKVMPGQTRSFQATITGPDGLKPPPGLVYRWEPSTEVAFTPAEGTKSASTGKFTGLGRVKVWVSVLQKTGPTLSTVAESNQIEIEVAPPEISLVADQASPYPGQVVRVTASESPSVPNTAIVYTWEHAGEALTPGAEKNPRVYSFRPTTTKPVTITARAKLKDGGLDLGTKSIVVTAKPYGVSVSGPTPRGPTPQLWDTKAGGLVNVEGRFAVFQDLGLRADVAPAPANAPLSYAWSVQPDGCTLSNPMSQTPTVNCSKTGTFQVAVAVKDKLGAALGAGSGQVPITVSQKDLDSSQAKAAAAQKAAERAAQKARDEEARRQAAAQKAAEQAAAKKAADEAAARLAAEQGAQKKRDEEAKRRVAAQRAAEEAARKAREEQAARAAAAARAREDEARQQEAEQARWRRLQAAIRTQSEGEALEKAGRLREAIAKYRESLTHVDDPALVTHIAQLEAEATRREREAAVEKQRTAEAARQAELRRQADAAARAREEEERRKAAEEAERLIGAAIRTQSEGEAFEREGKLREAIAKYRESVSYVPDPELDERIARLTAEIARRERAGAAAAEREAAANEEAARRRAGDARRPPATGAALAPGPGHWEATLNTSRGTMTFQGSGGTALGYPIADARVDGNTVRFTRVAGAATQHYVGTMAGGTMSGTFTQESAPGQTFRWTATWVAAPGTSSPAPAPAQSPATPSVPARPPAAACTLTGTWEFTKDGGAFILDLRQSGSDLSGIWTIRDEGETGSANVSGRVSGRNLSLSVTMEGETQQFRAVLSEDCRTLRLTLEYGGENITVTLTRR